MGVGSVISHGPNVSRIGAASPRVVNAIAWIINTGVAWQGNPFPVEIGAIRIPVAGDPWLSPFFLSSADEVGAWTSGGDGTIPAMIDGIRQALGTHADSLSSTSAPPKIPRAQLHLPGPDFVDRIFAPRTGIRGYREPAPSTPHRPSRRLGIPVDPARGSGHRAFAGASFAKNPAYFDPENIVKLAIEGGCNAVASTYGVLGIVARKYAHRIPFPGEDQSQRVADVSQQSRPDPVRDGEGGLGRWGGAVGATIYFGSTMPAARSWKWPRRSSRPTSMAWRQCCGAISAIPPQEGQGLLTCPPTFTGQANHLGVTIQADIIKQKLPENNGGFLALNSGDSSHGKLDKRMYSDLCSDHPIDLCRYQVANVTWVAPA